MPLTAVLTVLLSAISIADEANQKLWAAARLGDVAAIAAAIESGADVNAANPNEYGKTALHLAAEKGHVEVVRQLLDHETKLDAKDSFYQDTPLSWAVYGRRAAVVALLLERGAPGADAALIAAQRRGDVDLMRVIIEKGKVKPETLNRCLAQAAGRADVVALLEKAGAVVAPPVGDSVAPELLAALAGSYTSDAGGAFDLVASDGKLLMQFAGQAFDEWRSTSKDALASTTNPTTTVQIDRDGDRIVGLTVSTGESKRVYKRGPPEEPNPLPGDGPEADAPWRIVPRNWPSFRGQNASGVADDQWPPVTWNLKDEKNIRWRTPIPGLGNSCPIVWDDFVIVTSAVRADGAAELKLGGGDVDSVPDEGVHSWRIFCLDRSSGRVLWEKEAYRGVPKVKRHAKSTHADCTPVTDGKHIVVNFASQGLYCYDFAGKELWRRDLGTLDAGWFFNSDFQWGYGSSPIIHGDLAIVQCDVRENSFIAAYRLADGSEAWRTPRDEISSWGTPTIVQGPDRVELVTNASRFARGYDPATGAELWRLAGHSEITVPTPFFAENLIFVASGYTPIQPIYAIRPGARGDLSLAAGQTANDFVAWSSQKGGPYMATPVCYRQHLFSCKLNGALGVYEASTGKAVDAPKRIPGGGSYTASPVAADGKIYFTSEEGKVRVMQAGPPFALLANNSLGEPCLATPAIANGTIFFRTKSQVMAIGKQE